MSDNNVKQLMVSKNVAAEMLGVSVVTVERLTAQGDLPVVRMPSTGKVGRPRNMYSVAALQRFIESRLVYVDGGTPSPVPHGRRRKRVAARSAVAALEEAGATK